MQYYCLAKRHNNHCKRPHRWLHLLGFWIRRLSRLCSKVVKEPVEVKSNKIQFVDPQIARRWWRTKVDKYYILTSMSLVLGTLNIVGQNQYNSSIRVSSACLILERVNARCYLYRFRRRLSIKTKRWPQLVQTTSSLQTHSSLLRLTWQFHTDLRCVAFQIALALSLVQVTTPYRFGMRWRTGTSTRNELVSVLLSHAHSGLLL